MNISHLVITDDSHRHREGKDSHFTLHIVSDDFTGERLIERHKKVKNILKEEGVMSSIHALSIKTDTVEEYRHVEKDHSSEEIPCRSGYKAEKKK